MSAQENLDKLAVAVKSIGEDIAVFKDEFQTAAASDKNEIEKKLDEMNSTLAQFREAQTENEKYTQTGGKAFDPKTGEGFSMARAINAVKTKNWSNAEYEQDIIKTMGMQTDAGGGFLVPETLTPGLIGLLQARTIFNSATIGVTEMPGVGGAMKFNRIGTPITVGTIKQEGDVIPASDLTIKQFSLEPKTAAVRVKIHNLMLENAPAAAEQWFTMQASRDMAIKCDSLFLLGDGSEGEPLGILNDPDIGSFTTTSGAVTYLQLVDALGDIMLADAYFGNLNWATHPTQRLEMLVAPGDTDVQVERHSLSAGPAGEVLGHPIHTTTTFGAATGANSGIFGAWDQSIIADFKGLEIRVSQEADDAFGKDETHIRLIKRFDTHRVQPSAFTKFAV
jgi:HK97 family phage major capsid protein